MCGVAMILGGPGDRRLRDIRRMTDRMIHRGPDAEGYWSGERCTLGHTRLAIIDPSGPGQPMVSADGTAALAFNGEVTNYRELRADLDYPFETDGDTEVLLAGLLRHGVGFLTRIRGQFAFIWHHIPSGTTVLGRDISGILPLYWSRDADRTVAASTISAIRAVRSTPATVDQAGLADYLTFRSVHAPGTMISGVHKVRPGHVVRIDGDGRATETAYWRPPAVSEDPSPLDAVASLDAALTASVRSALVADVPVGAYLSGGIDSSLLIALCRTLEPEMQLHTYSAGFAGAAIDEIPWADAVAHDLGTTHHVVRVEPEDFMHHWTDLSRHREAPLSEPADIAVYLLARRAREDVRVVLSGEGSDELFAGYPKYLWARRVAQTGRAVPAGLREFVARSAVEVGAPPRVHNVMRAWSARSPAERRAAWFAPFSEAERAALLRTDLPRRPHSPDTHPESRGEVRAMLMSDFLGWLPDNLLERGDRMSMAASVELRPPFLDPRVIDLALRLPDALKVRDGQTKWMVRQVGLRYLAPSIVHRPKAGFPVPLDAWFRGGLSEFAHDLLLGPTAYVQEALDRRMIEGLLTAHTSGRASAAMRLWTLLSLEVWHRSVLAGSTSNPAARVGRS